MTSIWDPPAASKVPGYTGHQPGMRNYVVGQTYANATVNASKANEYMKQGLNPAGLTELVDRRPQGRDFLYAQAAKSTIPDQPPPNYTMPVLNTASLPELTFKNRKFVDRKTFSEEVPELIRNGTRKIPGYTGHAHASQHVYGQSFGRIARTLSGGAARSTVTSQLLAGYADERPNGLSLQGPGSRVPGYTGHVPSKDPHIYGHSYTESTLLAQRAVEAIKAGVPASSLPELTDYRPQGRIDLYTQTVRAEGFGTEFVERTSKVPLHLNAKGDKFEHTKRKGRVGAEVSMVNAGRHRLPGYTGHLPHEKSEYGVTYGSMSRRLKASL